MIEEKNWTTAEQAIEWIHSLTMLGIKPGLKRMEWMLERLGSPERRLKFIHVGGTNGKGSTVSYLRHVLQEVGYDVGAFTSPYIERFQNRIQLNGVDIADTDLLALARQVKPLADELAQTELGSPTEFEVVTIIAILYFAKVAYPDFVIWEVGLGGRLDSTNVVLPILSIITNVGYDHMHILGHTLEEITTEKAGIIKPGVPVVTGVQEPHLLEVIQAKAQEAKSTVYPLGQAFQLQAGAFTKTSQRFSFTSMFKTYEDIEIRMMGEHQLSNAAIAVMALEVLKQYYAVVWEEQDLYNGMKKTNWLGRMETIVEQPLTVIDGAHNLQGLEAFRQTLLRYFGGQRITLFFSALKDKPLVEMLSMLEELVDEVIVTTFDFPRAPTIKELREQLGHNKDWSFKLVFTEDWYAYYQQLVQQRQQEQPDGKDAEPSVIFFTGSLYFISEIRGRLLKNEP